MSSFSVFDIAGPIMVGPSSSHTAGACKIGQFASALFNHAIQRVTFQLHGSFGSVYKGHATDRAVLSGIMRFKTSDPRLKDAFAIAKKRGIEFKYEIVDLGADMHPNTVKIIMEADGVKPMSVTGCSIGGGNITIVRINNFPVEIHSMVGKYKTLVCSHDRNKETLERLSKEIEKHGIHIASLESTELDHHALTVFNLEGRGLKLHEVQEIEEKIPGVEFVRSLHQLSN